MKNSKKISYFLSFLLFITISCSNNNTINKKEISSLKKKLKIEMRYEDMYTTTFTSVSCSMFEKTFLKIAKERKLTTNEIVLFNSFFNKTLRDNVQNRSLNTRIKFKIYYSDDTSKEVCIGLHSLEHEGIVYSIKKEFTDYLLKITKTKF